MKRILIIDSNIERCLAISDFLGNMGFETGVSDSNTRALSMLEEADPLPDFILLDIRNDNITNWMLYDKLKHSKEYGHIPVILMDDESVNSEVEVDVKLNAPMAHCLFAITQQLIQ